jgi:hypothetical protein
MRSDVTGYRPYSENSGGTQDLGLIRHARPMFREAGLNTCGMHLYLKSEIDAKLMAQ